MMLIGISILDSGNAVSISGDSGKSGAAGFMLLHEVRMNKVNTRNDKAFKLLG